MTNVAAKGAESRTRCEQGFVGRTVGVVLHEVAFHGMSTVLKRRYHQSIHGLLLVGGVLRQGDGGEDSMIATTTSSSISVNLNRVGSGEAPCLKLLCNVVPIGQCIFDPALREL